MAVKSLVEMGIQDQEEKFCRLTQILIENNRIDDLYKACTDKEFRKKLFDELNIK